MNWFAKVRFDFVGRFASSHGKISRRDLVEAFGISAAQASGDIQGFLDAHPGFLTYDMRKKIYRFTGAAGSLPVPAWDFLREL